jgi:glutamyl-tRNA reductase
MELLAAAADGDLHMGLSDYLRRFRPAGTPGAAAPAGVPRDVTRELEDELGPMFAALEDARRDAEFRRRSAREEATRLAAAADAKVESARTDGRRRVNAIHSDVSAQRSRLLDQEREEVLGSAARRAAELEARARERLPAMVNRVVETVLQGPTLESDERGEG